MAGRIVLFINSYIDSIENVVCWRLVWSFIHVLHWPFLSTFAESGSEQQAKGHKEFPHATGIECRLKKLPEQ